MMNLKTTGVCSVLMTLSLVISPPVSLAQTILPTVAQAATPSVLQQLFDRGSAAQNAGRYAEAEAIWRSVLQQLPSTDSVNISAAYTNLGNALHAQNKLQSAYLAFSRAIEYHRDAYAYSGRGLVLYELRRWDEAIADYREAVRIDPTFALAYRYLGDALFVQHQDLVRAEEAYRKAITLDPEDYSAWVGLGNSLDDQNQPNEAIEAYRRAIQIQPQQPNAYIELAVTLMRQSRFAESAQAFRAAVQIRPDPRSLTGLGRVLFQQGQIEGESGAISAFNQALQIDATYSDAYEGLVGIYRFKIQQEPNRVDNYVVLGDLLYLWNRLDAALTTYDQALAIDPNYATAYNGRGSVFLSRNQIPEAIDQFRKAAELDPNHAYALANLGTAFRLNRQLDRAIASYRQALQADEMGGLPATAHVLAYLGLGLALKQKGDAEGAIAAFKQALELSPNYEPAQSNLTEMLNPSVANAPEQIPSRRQQPLIGVLRAVVWIKTETLLDGTAFGTGWIVKREGDRAWIVTNRHVIFDRGAGQPAEDVAIMLYSEGEFRRQLPARVVQVSNHEQLDMALLEVSNLPEDIEPLQLSTAPVPIETPIRVIGHPMGEDGTVFPWNSVIGKISGYSAEELRIDATLGGGVSGAPVLDERNNQVLGLTWGGTRLDRGTGGIGSAYPTQYFVEQLRSWGVTE